MLDGIPPGESLSGELRRRVSHNQESGTVPRCRESTFGHTKNDLERQKRMPLIIGSNPAPVV